MPAIGHFRDGIDDLLPAFDGGGSAGGGAGAALAGFACGGGGTEIGTEGWDGRKACGYGIIRGAVTGGWGKASFFLIRSSHPSFFRCNSVISLESTSLFTNTASIMINLTSFKAFTLANPAL